MARNNVVVVEDEATEKEYTLIANITVVAFSEQEAIEKARNGEIVDVDIVDVLRGVWAI